MHDKTVAWMGEVKAMISLSRRDSLKEASFWRIGGVFLYLICITVLGTVASSLTSFILVPGDATLDHIMDYLHQVTEDE